MPILGFLLGGIDFRDLRIVLVPASEYGTEVAIGWGSMLNSIIDFLLIFFLSYLVIKTLIKTDQKPKILDS